MDEENNKLDEKKIELLIDKKISDAKLAIAERRLNWILAIGAAFLTIFGIIVPIFISQQSGNKVDQAIEMMESKYNELTVRQSRKPKIECYVDGNNLTNNVVQFSKEHGLQREFILKNVGDGTAEYVNMKLYLNSEDTGMLNRLNMWDFDLLQVTDKPEFKWSFKYNKTAFTLPAKDLYAFQIFISSGNLKKDAVATALLKVFYGEPNPQEIPFTIKIKHN